MAYYILPDGRRAENRKEAKEMLNIGNSLFRSLRKVNLIKRITDVQASDNSQEDGEKEISQTLCYD